MNIKCLNLTELHSLLKEIAASQLPNKVELIKGIQNQISSLHLEAFEIAYPSMEEQLIKLPLEQLSRMIDSFLKENLNVPRELYMVYENKRERASRKLLEELLKDPEVLPK
jgi:hypothetical protein